MAHTSPSVGKQAVLPQIVTACHSMLQAEVNQGLQEGLEVLKQQKALAEALSQTRGDEMQGLKQQIASLTGQLTEAQERVQQAEIIRRKLHNTILVRLQQHRTANRCSTQQNGRHNSGVSHISTLTRSVTFWKIC